jgi:hypothetical protein
MANSRAKNVYLVDTDATTLSQNLTICGIKYIGAAASSVTIKDESSAGAVLWEENATTNVWNPDLDIKSSKGIYIAITGTAKVYLYVE